MTAEAATRLPDSRALLTVEDVAELLRVPVSWVYERTRKRGMTRIPGFRLGKYWRFREADVLAWLDRQRAGGSTNA
jgi:excisionase family DNA binding protein